MKRRRRLTKAQKKEIKEKAAFWAAHAGHWAVAVLFVTVTFGLVYTFWAQDAAFASVMLGG